MSPNLILWIVIGIAALFLDILTSAFLFVWFTVGAICAIISDALGYSVAVQFIVFIIVSIVLVLVCYPLIKKNVKNKIKPTALREETYKGREIIVDAEMQENNAVKLDGVLWKIEDISIKLQKGQKFKILGMNGNKVIIKKLES
jgi:membrane protein implicated in regulation of membrane protease activity